MEEEGKKRLLKALDAIITTPSNPELLNDPEISSIIELLKLFNIFEEDLKFKSEHAISLLRSLKLYISNEYKIFENWKEIGSKHNASSKELLQNGMQFLYELERKRVEDLKDGVFIDRKEIILLVIKAQIEKSKEPQYLFQYSTRGHKYQMIGGYQLENETEEEGIERLLKKELSENTVQNYKIEKIFNRFSKRVSNKTAVYTKFNVKVYYVELSDIDVLKLTDQDAWLTIDEMKSNQTSNGKLIMSPLNNPEAEETDEQNLKQLPLSLKREQPYKKIVIPEENNDSKIHELLKLEESESLEFKSTIRWDLRQNKLNKGLEKVILKTITAFLNTNDGKLLIGVDDDKNILGLDKDLSTLKKKDEDGLMLHLVGLINSYLGVEFNEYIDISMHTVDGDLVCMVTVRKSPQPIFMKLGDNREFYVRTGNRSSSLNPEETYKYISVHW